MARGRVSAAAFAIGTMLALAGASAQGRARVAILATGETIAGAGDASGYEY